MKSNRTSLRSRLSMIAGVLLFATHASATVIGGSVTGGTALSAGGTFVKLSVPLSNPFGAANSVGNDTFQSVNLFAFDEDQNILLGSALATDVGLNPIPAGQTVASHYVFFDPSGAASIVGTVDFDSDVIAILTSQGLLLASDFLANTGVNYLNPTLRGLESGDSVTISGARQILFSTTASTPGDYVRVLTAFSPGAVPEPQTLSLMGLGLVLLGAKRRRKA